MEMLDVNYMYTCVYVSDDGVETSVTYDNYNSNNNYECAGYSFIPPVCFEMEHYEQKEVFAMDENSCPRIQKQSLYFEEPRKNKNGEVVFHSGFSVKCPSQEEILNIAKMLWKSKESEVVLGIKARFMEAVIIKK